MKQLTKQQIKNVIEGKGAANRIPMSYHLWAEARVFGENEALAQEYLNKYPCDIEKFYLNIPDVFHAPDGFPDYRWIAKDVTVDETIGLDARIALPDWDDLDELLENFPDAEYPHLIPQAGKSDTYRLAHWWYLLFERLWSLRGMENALMDFYTNPEKVHALFDKLTTMYCRIFERAKNELDADGMFLSDDIGTQTSAFFSLDIFNEFFKPYYKIMADKAHSLGMHIWLHCCGNVELFLPGLIEIGIDVIHPIQKYAMDEQRIAREFGGQICFWAGFDVQQVIPYGTEDEVRAEVRHLIDTFKRDDGRLILTFGNGITEDCPVNSLYAALDESYSYLT